MEVEKKKKTNARFEKHKRKKQKSLVTDEAKIIATEDLQFHLPPTLRILFILRKQENLGRRGF